MEKAGGEAGGRTDRRTDARQRKRDRDKLLKAKRLQDSGCWRWAADKRGSERGDAGKKRSKTKQTQMEPSNVRPPSPTHPES